MSKYKIHPGKEIFPIRSSTACMLKWNWSSIFLNEGTTSSCHRCKTFPIDPDKFQDYTKQLKVSWHDAHEDRLIEF